MTIINRAATVWHAGLATFCLFLAAGASAFSSNGEDRFESLTGTAGCESHSLIWVLEDVDFSDNDEASNRDHFAVALLNGNDELLSFTDASRFNIQSPGTVELALPLTGVSARPVRVILYDKDVTAATPQTDSLSYANANYRTVAVRSTELLLPGLEGCEAIPIASCPDPFLFGSGLEPAPCTEDTVDPDILAQGVASQDLCIAPGSVAGGPLPFDYCQGSCAGGQGCAVFVETSDRLNVSEDRYCSSYRVSAPVVDFSSSLLNCNYELQANFYFQAQFDGLYVDALTWGFTEHSTQVQNFELEIIDDNCALIPAPVETLLLGEITDQALSVIDAALGGHFEAQAGVRFCPVRSLHPEFIE